MVVQYICTPQHRPLTFRSHLWEATTINSPVFARIFSCRGGWYIAFCTSCNSLGFIAPPPQLKWLWNIRQISTVQFVVSDWVYVRLHPYCQTSLTLAYTKLSKHFYGPFFIKECIGPIAYRLKLPETSKIHPVFHVSLLKQPQGLLPNIPYSLPPWVWITSCWATSSSRMEME